MVLSPQKRLRYLYLLILLISGTAISLQAKWLTIQNDFNHYDTDGEPIKTRSGCLCKFGDTYYWYGTPQSQQTDQTCYFLKDMIHWTNKGVMLEATRGITTTRCVRMYGTEKGNP